MDVDFGQGIIRSVQQHVERIVLDLGLDARDYTIEVRAEDYDREASTANPCMCLLRALAAFDATAVCVQYEWTEDAASCYKVLDAQNNGCPLRIMRRGRNSAARLTFPLLARFQYVCHRMSGSSLSGLFASFKCGDTVDCIPSVTAPRHVRVHLPPFLG